jgi:hypothetical protein
MTRNVGTLGLLSSEVETMSRLQPMHPRRGLSKKQMPLGELEDRLTWTQLYGR